MSLDELVKYLPEDNRNRIISLAGEGQGLLDGADFGHGMISSFWGDCVSGEIVNYLRRIGKETEEGYCNTIHDFYIDTRCGHAPRKQLRALQNELDLAINADRKPCAICGTATAKTAQRQHEEQQAAIVRANETRIKEGKSPNPLWNLSDKKLTNRNLTKDSYVCYFCYQNKLATIPKD